MQPYSNKTISNIRFTAIMAILFSHFLSLFVGSKFVQFGSDLVPETKQVILFSADQLAANINFLELLFFISFTNIAKFATISFFMISGFLFEQHHSYYQQLGISKFLNKKYQSLLRPYLLIFVLPITLISIYFAVEYDNIYFDIVNSLKIFFRQVFLSSYWFVPALFLFLFLNFFIKKNALFIVLILGSFVTVFYSLNIYFKWNPVTQHTLAIPGFLIFFVLGRLLYIKQKIFNYFSTYHLLILVGIFYIFSNLESYFLVSQLRNTDFLNSLRLTNVFFSLFAFLLLWRVFTSFGLSDRYISMNTYFLYLFHPIVTKAILLGSQNHLNLYDLTRLSIFWALPICIALIVVTTFIANSILNIRVHSVTIEDWIFKKKKVV